MKIGKLPNERLEALIKRGISRTGVKREEILIRPAVGEDCAAVHMGGEYCVLSTDPITGASKDAGCLAVHVNANDIAAAGCIPVGIMVTVLLPPKAADTDLQTIMDGVYKACAELHIEVAGGHTEVTDAVTRPVISCTVIGKTTGRRFVSSGGALPGQDVIMTKWAGLEGTAILANDHETALCAVLAPPILEKAKQTGRFLSVIPEARIASDFGAACMHDVTEGGVLGACFEIAECSQTGVLIEADKIPILPETAAVCRFFDLDPLRLISSGSLLAACFEGKKLVKRLEQAGITATLIGRITQKDRLLIANGRTKPLSPPGPDELYSVRTDKTP